MPHDNNSSKLKTQIPLVKRAHQRVTVLLALYNGIEHLRPQLQSYMDQTLVPVRVLASDDNPGDGTGAAFRRFAAKASESCSWELIDGPKRGLTRNFLHLLAQVDPESTDYIALSDQDDIWLPAKLESAVALIADQNSRNPILLGTRSWEWDAKLDQRVLSRHIPDPLDFTHALVQNYAGGNTMVLNRAALRLVQQALPNMPSPALHDWWLYQLIAGAGGTVLLDSEPRLLYRQHAHNQVGANATIFSKFSRFKKMLGGTYRNWMDQNLTALDACKPLLTPSSNTLLTRLQKERNGTFLTRLILLHETGLHRKGRINQAALWIAAALRRL